jgi:hypothetical protein
MPARLQRRSACAIAFIVVAIATAARGQVQEGLPLSLSNELPAAVTLEQGLDELPAPPPLAPPDVPGTQPALPDELLGKELTGTEAIGTELLVPPPCARCVAAPFGYNLRSSSTSWLLGGGNQLGMFSLESLPTLQPGEQTGIVTGIGLHWLSGPVQTDLPPRLFDFQIGLQRRKWLTASLGYDIAARIGAFSDFEASAREGIRYPSHAVGYYRASPGLDFVLGVDYLSRDDVKVLPVAGLIMKPRDNVRLELVFPRPCVEWQINSANSVYLAGELGGGTWAIERAPPSSDVVTYRDYRLLLGLSTLGNESSQSAIEFGYVFGRRLSYRSGSGDYSPIDTLVVQITQRY